MVRGSDELLPALPAFPPRGAEVVVVALRVGMFDDGIWYGLNGLGPPRGLDMSNSKVDVQ